MNSNPYLTIGAVAVRFAVRPWQVRRLFESGHLPEPHRVGAYRVLIEADMPAVEKALREAGYLPEEAGVTHAR